MEYGTKRSPSSPHVGIFSGRSAKKYEKKNVATTGKLPDQSQPGVDGKNPKPKKRPRGTEKTGVQPSSSGKKPRKGK